MTISDQATEVASLRKQVECQQDQCSQIENEFNKYKEVTDAEIQKNREIKKKFKKIRKTLKAEV